MKKIIKMFLFFILFIPLFVKASSTEPVYNEGFLLNGKLYNTFLEAFNDAKDGDTITLFENVTLESTLIIDKDITINLNGNTIESADSVLRVQGGHLKLIGDGVVKETSPNMYAVLLKGSTNKDDNDYSYVYVGKDVILEGWAPVFIDKLGNVGDSTYNSSYGVKADIYGTLHGVDDTSGGSGIGVYVNGIVQDKDNYPIVNIHDGASVTGSGVGIYMAGYSDFNINKANISGIESGIGIKAGKLTLNGTTVIGTGEEEQPSSSTNGINPTGAALQIESNKAYLGNVDINIKNSTLKSNNNSSIVEYIANGTTDTSVIGFKVSNSELIPASGKSKISASEKFVNRFSSVIENVSVTMSEYQLLTINKSKSTKLILFALACIGTSILIFFSVKNQNKKSSV